MKKSKRSPNLKKLQQVCLFTQVCFVRNLAGEKFPNALSPEERTRLGDHIASVLCSQFKFTDITHDPTYEGLVGSYLHLLPEEDRDAGYHLLELYQDFYCEVMATNHLTFTIRTDDIDLLNVAIEAEAVLDRINKTLPFAFHEKYGFLTAQLPVLGTGFRVRSMLHLPGLSHFNYLRELCNAAELNGVLVELDSPEPPPGHLIMLFNRFSLGRSVEQILMDYAETLFNVIDQEQRARQRLLRDEPFVLLDLLLRCRAILNTTLLLSENEAMDALSDIRLASGLGILKPGLNKQIAHRIWFTRPSVGFVNAFLKGNPDVLQTLPPQVAEFTPWRIDAIRANLVRTYSEFKLKDTFIKRALEQ